MVKIIDKRDKKITTFGELKIGQFFIDDSDNFVIKINSEEGCCISEDNCFFLDYSDDENVTSVEIEINIIR